jgi:hypothetical protein
VKLRIDTTRIDRGRDELAHRALDRARGDLEQGDAAHLRQFLRVASGFCAQPAVATTNPIYEVYLATNVSGKVGAVFFVMGPTVSAAVGVAESFLATGSALAYADPGTAVTFAAVQFRACPHLACPAALSDLNTG